MEDYLKINKKAWEGRTHTHIGSSFYDLNGFLQGKSSLPPLDYELLGDLQGKSLLHLQCHFGMDTLSVARKGTARIVGVDFSESAVIKARELNTQLGLDAEFICSDIYKLPEVLNEQFDIVYTSYGVISWLESLDQWGQTITHFLKPGGRSLLIEFHPVLWMLGDDLRTIEYAYSRKEPYISVEGTYTENGAESVYETVNWNYGIAEPVGSLIKNGLQITGLHEYRYSPVNLFGRMVETAPGEYQLAGLEDKVPLLYAITAVK